MNKAVLLKEFRKQANLIAVEIDSLNLDYKKKASKANKMITEHRNIKITEISNMNLDSIEQLEFILMINYVSYIVMLEIRNHFWGYDYMTFSRRIGEIWEPFCKLPFNYPIRELEIFTPPTFLKVESVMYEKTYSLVKELDIPISDKEELLGNYQDVWKLVDSSNISLKLDLHFYQDNIYYDVDYKSGFSSNEKGNTNRLLQVASIYNSYFDNHKNLIFVRQPEEENNHYLQVLKNSPNWTVYCADEAYNAIYSFTGYNLKQWMEINMDWTNDISEDFKKYLIQHDLLKYLTW